MAATAKKKPTSKKPRSTKSKATAKKAASKSLSAKNSSKQSSKPRATTDRLRKFNIFAAVSNAIFAILSIVFISSNPLSWNLPYGAKDEFASTTTAVFGPAYRTFGEIDLRYILAFIFGLSAVFSLMLATRLKGRYENQVAKSGSTLRWIFSGITLGILLELVTRLTQISSIVTLKMVVALVLTTVILWIFSEQQIRGAKRSGLFYLSLFTLFLAAMPVIVSLVGSGIYGMEWFGWHVYLLALVTLGGLAAMAFSQYKQAKINVSPKSYIELEGRYLSMDYLIKFSAFIILLIAFFK